MEAEMAKGGSILGSLTLMVIGAGAAMLFTPVSGKDARKKIKEQYDGMMGKAKQTAMGGAQSALQYAEKTAEAVRDTAEHTKEQIVAMEEMAGQKGGTMEQSEEQIDETEYQPSSTEEEMSGLKGGGVAFPEIMEETMVEQTIVEDTIIDEGAMGTKVNLNMASMGDLESVDGIEPDTASAIIAYRETQGRINDVSEIRDIVGASTFEVFNLKDQFEV
jgi:competence ComEA-like helix-hairpin-helix protein